MYVCVHTAAQKYAHSNDLLCVTHVSGTMYTRHSRTVQQQQLYVCTSTSSTQYWVVGVYRVYSSTARMNLVGFHFQKYSDLENALKILKWSGETLSGHMFVKKVF